MNIIAHYEINPRGMKSSSILLKDLVVVGKLSGVAVNHCWLA